MGPPLLPGASPEVRLGIPVSGYITDPVIRSACQFFVEWDLEDWRVEELVDKAEEEKDGKALRYT
jgi:hypothetical protein